MSINDQLEYNMGLHALTTIKNCDVSEYSVDVEFTMLTDYDEHVIASDLDIDRCH